MIAPSLAAALDAGGFELIVTSGQRLSRHITEHQARTSIAAEHTAWTAADVLPWSALMRRVFEASAFRGAQALPVGRHLLNSAQARSLWAQIVDETLQQTVDDMLGADALVNDVMQAYGLMQRYQIDRSVLAASAMDEDSQFLLRCIDSMAARLDSRGWLLEDQLPALLTTHAKMLGDLLPERILLAGFGRLTPDQEGFVEAFGQRRFLHHEIEEQAATPDRVIASPSHQQELIAAGQWSRQWLYDSPDARLAVVVPGLSANAQEVTRWFSEGFIPGAQGCADPAGERGFEVSFGEPLAGFPAVSCVLELLQLAVRPARFSAYSRLLRNPVLNPVGETDAATLELRLREQPDRRWSLSAVRRRLTEDEVEPIWLSAVTELHEEADQRRMPSAWAQRIDTLLNSAGWLTVVETSSEVFQLRNAFHTSLNSLASLDEVAGAMTLSKALGALRERVQTTIYQPEGGNGNVLVCGPLETLGLHFDAIWIAGLDVTRWPPAGRGASLLPRSLQRDYELPDATPEQSRVFWERQFAFLLAAAPVSVASFAKFEGDSELMAATMIADRKYEEVQVTLGVVPLVGQLAVQREPESLESFDVARRCHGGQATLRMLMSDPFSASVQGRWACTILREPEIGVNALQRGQIVHRALQLFYQSVADSQTLRALGDDAQRQLVARAVADAIRPMFVDADDVLSELLRLEEERCRTLIDRFVAQDGERPDFEVEALEQSRKLVLRGLRIGLRVDRVDRVNGAHLIIDYKTGSNITGVNEKSIVDKHFQLLAYALTERGALAGLALARIAHEGEPMLALVDTDIAPLGKHRQVRAVASLDARLAEWRALADSLAQQFIDGDIRLNPALDRAERKDTALLSRIAEERRDEH